jgi:hypothetical protein
MAKVTAICQGYVGDSTNVHGIEYDPATSDAEEPSDYCSRKCELTVETFDQALTPLVPIEPARSIPDRALDMSAERMARQFQEAFAAQRHRCEQICWIDKFYPRSDHGRALIATFHEMLSGTIQSMFER